MKASKLRQRITLITVTTTQSLTGGSPKTTYTEGPTIWANIEPLSTRDVIQAKAAFLSRLCGGEDEQVKPTYLFSFLSRLCGGEGTMPIWITSS